MFLLYAAEAAKMDTGEEENGCGHPVSLSCLSGS